MSKKKIILIASMLVVNATLVAYYTWSTPARGKEGINVASNIECKSERANPLTEESRVCFDDYIKKVGPEKAAKDFMAWNVKYDPNQQHSYAHVFGGVLYSHTGSPGLKYCSPNFAYGCFHEFIGKAIRKEGVGVTLELNEGCRRDLGDLALGCQHGIGHGVQSALGYEKKDLLKSLEVCKGLPYNDSIGGCYGGVFMEYNMRTVLATDGGTLRPMIEGQEDECPTLPKDFVAPCYYWQPQWWSESLREKGMSENEIFAMIGGWCRKGAVVGREQCFRGIGNIDPAVTLYDVEKSIALCRSVVAGDHTSFKYCIEDVANSFNSIPEARPDTPKICAALTKEEAKFCLERLHFDPSPGIK
jgi:hypothetical protein